LDFGTRRAARPVPKVKKFLAPSLERSMPLVDCLMPKVFDLVDVPNVTASALILILCDKSKTLIFNKQF
jgi:hypothetical protein